MEGKHVDGKDILNREREGEREREREGEVVAVKWHHYNMVKMMYVAAGNGQAQE